MIKRICSSLALLALLDASAQTPDATSCQQAYETARELYSGTRFTESLHLLDSLRTSCGRDKDLKGRILFLKALIEAKIDSVSAMRGTMEQLFRNDRNYVLKPYDPLIVGEQVKEEIFYTYERLAGSRDNDVGPGLLRKDHGQWRAGLYVQGHQSLLDVGEVQQVFENDAPPKYTGLNGWEVGMVMEYDLIPNLALRASAGYGRWSLEATSSTLRYEEQFTFVPLCLGLKKMFWLKESPWVPYIVAEGTYGQMLAAQATIERSGDGLRFLSAKTLDRKSERTQEQIWVGGALGVGYKVNSVVLTVEARYRHALEKLTIEDAGYTESELLTNYYWKDAPVTLNSAGVALGIQYVLRYHARNRIYQ